MEELSEDTRPNASDSVYMDFCQCEERLFHPMFHVRFDKKRPFIQMFSHILRRDGTQSIESLNLTSWENKTDTDSICSLLQWTDTENPDEAKIYEDNLYLDELLMLRFLPRHCSVDNKCILCQSPEVGSPKLKCPNDNCVRKGHTVFTPIRTKKERYKVKYDINIFPPEKIQNTNYPSFNSAKTIKLREAKKKELIIQNEDNVIHNYVLLPTSKFSNIY